MLSPCQSSSKILKLLKKNSQKLKCLERKTTKVLRTKKRRRRIKRLDKPGYSAQILFNAWQSGCKVQLKVRTVQLNIRPVQFKVRTVQIKIWTVQLSKTHFLYWSTLLISSENKYTGQYFVKAYQYMKLVVPV